MTMRSSTACNIIQSFPALLILAQNYNRCLSTKFIYEPPKPTPSTEYYEALDALFQSLFSQSCHDDHTYGHQYAYGIPYGYNKKRSQYQYETEKPCHNKPYPDIPHIPYNGYPTYVTNKYPSGYGYPSYTGHGYPSIPDYNYKNHDYPSFGYNKVNNYNLSANDHSYKGYAPNQVYNSNHRYKIVVKKNKIGDRRRAQKLREVPSESCRTVDDEEGNCVFLLHCQVYMAMMHSINGTSTHVVDIIKKAHCGYDEDKPKVCCPQVEVLVTATPVPLTPEASAKNNTETEAEHYVSSFPEPPVCGFSNTSFVRVLPGMKIKLGTFPWMVILGYRGEEGGVRWSCGGFLVTPKHVITAAHCIHGQEDTLFVVRVGAVNLTREDHDIAPADVLITHKIQHEGYRPKNFVNDIGVLVLAKEIQYTDLIKPICIPLEKEVKSNGFQNHPLIASWTITDNGSAIRLQTSGTTLAKRNTCVQAFSKCGLTLNRSLVCTNSRNGRKVCGNSAGLLMLPRWSKGYKSHYAVGVVSECRNCSISNTYEIFTKISEYVPWLKTKILGTYD